MSRILQDGFEMGVPKSISSSGGVFNEGIWQVGSIGSLASLTVLGSDAHSGEYCYRIRHTSNSNRIVWGYASFEPQSELFGRVYFRKRSDEGNNWGVFHLRDEANTISIGVRTNNSTDMLVYVGGTLVGTITEALPGLVWHRIEFHFIGEETGGFMLRLNGQEVFSWEGNVLIDEASRIAVGTHISGSARDYTFDDVAINSIDGDKNNSWCGPGIIVLLSPKGAGEHSDFTPNANNNWEQVNEVPNDGDTSYVYSDVANELDTYEMEELVADKGLNPAGMVINAVQVCLTARFENTDAHIAPYFRSGTDEEQGETMFLSPEYFKLDWEIFEKSPFTNNPWTQSEIDALEAGVKHIEHVE